MSSLSGKQPPRYRHLADDTEPYETIAVEKLTPIIGAEISGVDIGKLVSDNARSNRQMDEIHRALGITGGNLGSTLVQIASSDPNHDLRRAAMEALFIRGDAHDLVAIAKSTNDVDTRKRAVEKLSLMDSKEARDYMLELLNK